MGSAHALNWVCFCAAHFSQNIHKTLIILALRLFGIRQIGFVLHNSLVATKVLTHGEMLNPGGFCLSIFHFCPDTSVLCLLPSVLRLLSLVFCILAFFLFTFNFYLLAIYYTT